MEIQFLFLDESFNVETKYSSLTGILIPLDKYEKIRNEFYNKILNQFINIGESKFNLSPPIIHGKELLKGTEFENNDEKKLEIFQMVVDIINDYSIKVYRLGWLKDKKSKLFKNLDSNLMGIIFPKFLELIDSDIKETKLIPIMDGLDNKISQIFSQYVKQLDILRQNINSNNLTIKNSQNIYGEVFYADSKFSILTQFVDMTSYMLHCKDYKDFRKNYGIFKGNIIEISERIRPELVNGKYYFTEVSI